jgi:hypothetical protein
VEAARSQDGGLKNEGREAAPRAQATRTCSSSRRPGSPPGWDAELARGRIGRLDLDPRQKAGTLSGGQRAQLALTLAVANGPSC